MRNVELFIPWFCDCLAVDHFAKFQQRFSFLSWFLQIIRHKIVLYFSHQFSFSRKTTKFETILHLTKGQLISKGILWNHRFSKIPSKNLIDFCPRKFYRLGTYFDLHNTFLGRNLSNFSGEFWKIDDFIKYLLKLTDL